jgi:hypothetical protein
MSGVVAEADIHQGHARGGVPVQAPAHKEGSAGTHAAAAGVPIFPDTAIPALGEALR